ncbi:MAG: hypothetical protein R3263_09170 [Myxococcota bacterium]|nr:hypothetical protein [Myxococcota bacterium]
MRPFPKLPRLSLPLLVLLVASPAAADVPVDLEDPRPRAIRVRFEVSPRDRPAQRDARWTEPLPARLEPTSSGQVRVVVPARVVEERLLAEQGVVPGSFDDFVWVFDARTGQVLSASFRGTLSRALGLGFLKVHTDVELDVTLSTREAVSFREGHRVLGELVHAPCDAPEDPECARVAPEPYDPETGAVYAVGVVRARSGPFGSRSLCPFGEAVFLEAPPGAPEPGLPAVASGPPPLSAVGAEAAH